MLGGDVEQILEPSAAPRQQNAICEKIVLARDFKKLIPYRRAAHGFGFAAKALGS